MDATVRIPIEFLISIATVLTHLLIHIYSTVAKMETANTVFHATTGKDVEMCKAKLSL